MSEKQSLILVGGGGHCRSVIDVIEQEGKYSIIGIVDNELAEGTMILNYPVIGKDEQIAELMKSCSYFHIAVGHIRSNHARVNLFGKIVELGGSFPVIVSPTAYVSPHAEIGAGTIVMHHVTVNAAAKIGVNNIINTGAIIEHDASVANHCHISTHSVINGECAVADHCFIGSGSILIQQVKVADNNLIAAGSVVTADTDAGFMYAGNPATKKKSIR